MYYGIFLFHNVIISSVRFVDGLVDFCGCMAESNFNIIRDDSCWLEHNGSGGQILLNDICSPKRGKTIVRRTL